MSMSNYLEEQILHETLRGVAYTSPETHIALFTADPTDAGTGAEVTTTEGTGGWTNYARQNAAGAGAQSAAWSAYSSGSCKNANVITFPPNNNASASVTVTHIGIYDAATSGNLLYHAPLSASKIIQPGDVLSFAVNAITVTLD